MPAASRSVPSISRRTCRSTSSHWYAWASGPSAPARATSSGPAPPDRLGDLGRSLGTRQGNGQRPRRRQSDDDIAILGLEGQAVQQRGQRIGPNTLHRRTQGQIIAATIGWEQRHGPPRQRLVVKPQAGLDGGVELERGEPAQGRDRIRLAGKPAQFSADPGPADRFQRAVGHCRLGELARGGLDSKREPARVASQPQEPRGVIDETLGMQDPERPSVEVVERVRHRDQPPRLLAAERDRHRVDREVSSLQVLIQARWGDVG